MCAMRSGISKMIVGINIPQLPIQVQSFQEKVLLLHLVGDNKSIGMAVGILNVRLYSLYILVGMYEDWFKFHQVKPPFPCLKTAADNCLLELVVISGYRKSLLKGGFHLVVIIGIVIKTSQPELYTFWCNVHFAHHGCFVSVETTVRIVHVQILGRILLDDNIYRSTHGGTPEFGRNNSFVYLNAIDHFHRNIIDVDKIGIVIHRLSVNEKPNAFSFQPSYGNTRSTAHSSHCPHGDTGRFC